MGTVAYVKTPVTPTQMKAALQQVFPSWSDKALAILGAQWSLETGAMGSFASGWTSSQFNYNPAGITGSYHGASVTPPGMSLTFRSYPDVLSGVVDWVNVLEQGYPGALQAAAVGNLAGYMTDAQMSRYCGGCNVSAYRAALQTRQAWFLKMTPPGPAALNPPSTSGLLAFIGAVSLLAGAAAYLTIDAPRA